MPIFQRINSSFDKCAVPNVVQLEISMMKTTYRAMPRSRPLTSSVQKKKILERVTELIQYLSRRYGVLRLLANFTAISIFAFLLTPFFFAAKVSRYLRSRLVEFYGRRSVLITFDVPGLQHADENVLSVHLLDSSVDVDHFAAHIQKWIAEQPMLKLRRRSVLRGWMHLWSNPEGTFQTGNHLVELVPTWKHRLVTEDTVDDYVSHISRLPLGGAIPPWKLFVIQLQGGAGGAGCDAARTCLVVKCHRRLSDALDAFIRREETLGRKNDAYSMILYDAALRLDDANDAAAAASVAAAGAPPPTAAGRTKLQSLQLFLVKFKVQLETWCWMMLCVINGPRIVLECLWKVCVMAKAGAIDASLNGSDGWRRLTLTWTPSLPRHFFDQICKASGATSHQVLLSAFSQAMTDHFKQSGSLPEVLRVHVPLKTPAMSRTLPDVCDGSAMKCDLGLPCRTEDSRHVLETIQERMTKVLNRRRQRMRMYVTERWMRICSVYTPWILLPFWRWLVDGSCASVVMETNDFAWHPLIQSSFKWNTSSPKTQLAVSLSRSGTTVRVGLISSVLPASQLNPIAQNIERYIYQVAASYGVQQRKLSPYSTPHSTPPPTPSGPSPPPSPEVRRRRRRRRCSSSSSSSDTSGHQSAAD